MSERKPQLFPKPKLTESDLYHQYNRQSQIQMNEVRHKLESIFSPNNSSTTNINLEPAELIRRRSLEQKRIDQDHREPYESVANIERISKNARNVISGPPQLPPPPPPPPPLPSLNFASSTLPKASVVPLVIKKTNSDLTGFRSLRAHENNNKHLKSFQYYANTNSGQGLYINPQNVAQLAPPPPQTPSSKDSSPLHTNKLNKHSNENAGNEEERIYLDSDRIPEQRTTTYPDFSRQHKNPLDIESYRVERNLSSNKLEQADKNLHNKSKRRFFDKALYVFRALDLCLLKTLFYISLGYYIKYLVDFYSNTTIECNLPVQIENIDISDANPNKPAFILRVLYHNQKLNK